MEASRSQRRRQRTRAALVGAARELLIRRDPATVSIKEITETADVGFGSFYNHFESKDDVFAAAIIDVLDEHGAMLDELTAGLDDPAEVFAASVRITARFPRTRPDLAAIMVRTGPSYLASDRGLAPRALRDLERAKDAGRLQFTDALIALACVGGALMGVVHTFGSRRRDVDRAADELTYNLLRMFGLAAPEARVLVARPLPKPRRRARPATTGEPG